MAPVELVGGHNPIYRKADTGGQGWAELKSRLRVEHRPMGERK